MGGEEGGNDWKSILRTGKTPFLLHTAMHICVDEVGEKELPKKKYFPNPNTLPLSPFLPRFKKLWMKEINHMSLL